MAGLESISRVCLTAMRTSSSSASSTADMLVLDALSIVYPASAFSATSRWLM